METSWTTREQGKRITIVHDNRWLAIIGIPLGVFGLGIAIGPWFIESARNSDAWPILAVGSLIGVGFIVAGLSLCFKYEEFIADLRKSVLIRNIGLNPFRRTKEWPLEEFEQAVCVDEQMSRSSGPGSSLHHRLQLTGPNVSVLLASDLETDTILTEGQRWSKFLDLPLQNHMGETREEQLKRKLEDNRPTK